MATIITLRGKTMAAEEIIVSLENRPGTLADVTETLAEADVNIDGVTCQAQGTFGVARFVTDNPGKAFKALEKQNLPVTRREVTTVRLPNEPGQLAEATRKLADSGINIESLFANASGQQEGEIVIETDNPAGAKKALGL